MTANVLLLGAPGAGKGTQSQRLADEYDLEHVTTGDALRANKEMETEHGTPREYMDAGELVPDPVVNAIVEKALGETDGYVLDGYPRTESQAAFLEEITTLDAVIHLEVPRRELVDRLTGRRVCDDCGRNYHVEFSPPEEAGVCDDCGGELVQRDDDAPETVKNRIEVYEENTEPVVEFYRSNGELTVVDGEQPPDDVFADVRAAVDAE